MSSFADIEDALTHEIGAAFQRKLERALPRTFGVLKKMGGRSMGLKVFQKLRDRYFQIDGPYLAYWIREPDNNDRSPKGKYLLDGATVQALDDAKNPFGFSLCREKGEPLVLYATTEDERQKWIRALNGVIETLKAYPHHAPRSRAPTLLSQATDHTTSPKSASASFDYEAKSSETDQSNPAPPQLQDAGTTPPPPPPPQAGPSRPPPARAEQTSPYGSKAFPSSAPVWNPPGSSPYSVSAMSHTTAGSPMPSSTASTLPMSGDGVAAQSWHGAPASYSSPTTTATQGQGAMSPATPGSVGSPGSEGYGYGYGGYGYGGYGGYGYGGYGYGYSQDSNPGPAGGAGAPPQ